MSIIGIDHIQLAMPAGAEADARRFYGDLLGLTEIAKPAELAARGGCWFSGPSIQVHLGVEQEFAPARKAHPAFLVADLAMPSSNNWPRRASRPRPTIPCRACGASTRPTLSATGSSLSRMATGLASALDK